MQVICNYTNNSYTGFTYQQIYTATIIDGLLYVLNDDLKKVCIGGQSLTHTRGISDSTYCMSRFKEVTT